MSKMTHEIDFELDIQSRFEDARKAGKIEVCKNLINTARRYKHDDFADSLETLVK